MFQFLQGLIKTFSGNVDVSFENKFQFLQGLIKTMRKKLPRVYMIFVSIPTRSD